ncbi:TolC family protein [Deminuibacter soli]|uniref:TolC family protein n=1 Tax=Deminuibacter soli TaxID=2291815 RepID=A0A3E1NKS8_9BACT|nr:TolC family protein [Deminuibacter soli]RFM28522.1 TolC family protein [Deminuibacter soli]
MLLKLCYTTLLLFTGSVLFAQTSDTLVLTLQQVVQMAKEKSIASKQAITTKKTKYWQYRTYQSNYQPQLSLNGTLPGYNKTFTQVTQPDGTILFQSIHNNNSLLDLSFSQTIAATGATIFGTTQMQRFDDFDRKTILYNGVPFGIGYSQPLWQFNQLKWDRKIEPLKYRESTQAFIESMEQVAITASGYFFDLLLAQVNWQIAATNLQNTQKILAIAKEKLELGKVSKNEILQLQLELLKSQKAAGTARREMEIATLNLSAFTGLQTSEKIGLLLPDSISRMQAPTDKVLSEAYANRSDAIAFIRRMAEARRDIAKARGDNGLNAALTAQLGYSKSAPTISKVYQSPQNQQEIQLTFTIPILDWGRSKSRTKTAEANMEFTAYAVEQDKQIFTQEIVTQVTLFDMMKDQLVLTAAADSIAAEKYQIAKESYTLGKLSITDLSIAFQEKDQAKRDYIMALRDFWGAYYQLRYLSLYDFEKNEKITYR